MKCAALALILPGTQRERERGWSRQTQFEGERDKRAVLVSLSATGGLTPNRPRNIMACSLASDRAGNPKYGAWLFVLFFFAYLDDKKKTGQVLLKGHPFSTFIFIHTWSRPEPNLILFQTTG